MMLDMALGQLHGFALFLPPPSKNKA